MSKKKGTKFITEVPNGDGAVVSMITYKGQVLLACERCIYQLSEDSVFKKIEFEVIPEDRSTLGELHTR